MYGGKENREEYATHGDHIIKFLKNDDPAFTLRTVCSSDLKSVFASEKELDLFVCSNLEFRWFVLILKQQERRRTIAIERDGIISHFLSLEVGDAAETFVLLVEVFILLFRRAISQMKDSLYDRNSQPSTSGKFCIILRYFLIFSACYCPTYCATHEAISATKLHPWCLSGRFLSSVVGKTHFSSTSLKKWRYVCFGHNWALTYRNSDLFFVRMHKKSDKTQSQVSFQSHLACWLFSICVCLTQYIFSTHYWLS
jgi:hypothetical protein